ncbi:MAG: sterol desaturase family protein [Cytophagaceae bacterium]|nr:sterol desaturase family protein [Cytophagaceae bacterium]
MKNSFRSILIFGFSSLPIIYFVRTGFVVLLSDSLWVTLVGLAALIIWNEIHFFLVHRVMHWPIFYRYIHYMHHVSKIPTVYSVFSFHPVEAFLLSTVEVTIILFIPLSATAIFLYPLVSILLNYAGHYNYRFGNGSGRNWKLFGTRHSAHHYKNTNQYGFASPVLDKIFAFQKKLK